ncbi:MAG: xanthine dehydrogenase family protein subunit M [Candidatus Aminicenantes bacterium]|nr:xanthine dehydrogenase family protein subunit M [Candidatus Aminicenantes bacterium]
MNNLDFLIPQSLREVWDLYKRFPGVRFIAGGTDMMVKIKNSEEKPTALISLRSIPGLSGIEIGEQTRIGAMTTIGDLINHPQLGDMFPVLIQAVKRLGGPQIRNVATIGGNLCNCSPCADTALPLLVLEARAVLKRSEGSREVPLDEFFLGPGESCLLPGEMLTDIILNKPAPGVRATFKKKGRVRMDLSIVSTAVLLEMEGSTRKCKKARIAAGSVAPTPLRLKKVEELFENAEISEKTLIEAQKLAESSVSPITDIRSTAEYRRRIVGVYVKRAIQELLDF